MEIHNIKIIKKLSRNLSIYLKIAIGKQLLLADIKIPYILSLKNTDTKKTVNKNSLTV